MKGLRLARTGSLTLLLVLLIVPERSPLPEPPQSLAGQVAVVLAPVWWEEEAVRLGAQELARALEDTYGSTISLRTLRLVEASPVNAVLVERAEAQGSLSPEGYVLQAVRVGEGVRWRVRAADPLGAAYGLFHLARHVRLHPREAASTWELRAEPAMAFRLLADPHSDEVPSPEEALRLGFNAIMVAPWPALALYDGVAPELYAHDRYPQDRQWVEEQRQRARARLERAKALHLKVVSYGDLPSLPRQALPPDADAARVCLREPWVRALVQAALDEVLASFSLDAIMVRIGENYPLGPLVGSALRECDGDYPKAVAEALEFAAAAVARHDVPLLFRAWDLGAEGFHASPAVVSEVMARARPQGQVWVSFKHTQTDYWHYTPVNPNFGRTGLPEMVEFQAAREYEGKGAFPNYLGQVFADGAPEVQPRGGLRHAYQRGVRAIWVWGRGGGWDGPYPASPLWNEANVYALARLAWDPQADPETLAWEWAALRFGHDAAPFIARLLLRSAEATRLGFYLGPAAPQVGPWAPNLLWVRDDRVFGADYVRPLYRLSRSPAAFERTLMEKRRALAIVEAMERDLAAALPFIADKALAEEARVSLVYERTLLETLFHYLAGLFYTERWLSGEVPPGAHSLDRRLALQHLARWREAWEAHQTVARQPRAATPYRDAGMEAGVAEALALLQGDGRRPRGE